MIKAVLFDMDGVIIDSEPIHMENNREIFKNFGLVLDEEMNNSFAGTNSKYKWGLVKEKYNVPYTIEELIKIDRNTYQEYLNKNPESIAPIDGVVDFIKDLNNHGVKLALASSSPLDVINTVLDTIGIRKYFQAVVTGDYVKRSKPEPDIFVYAAEKLGVSNEYCMVVEDSTNGVTAAKKANMKCIGFANPNSITQDVSKADIVTDSFGKISYESIISY